MTTGRRILSSRSLLADAQLPAHEAARLLAAATGRDTLSVLPDEGVASAAAVRFGELAARRRSGEPLQYLEGTSQFGPVEVAVDPRVLIPRPETEQLWEQVTALLADRPPQVIVDLGTGSANLAIALKHEFPDAAVHAVDVSSDALQVAKANVASAGVQVVLHRGDLFDPVPADLRGKVDLVISNPPYIATTDYAALPDEVRDHEPAIALFAGRDGMSVLRRIIATAPAWLAPGGVLACEIGADQGAALQELAAGLNARIIEDLSGRDRFLIVQKGTE